MIASDHLGEALACGSRKRTLAGDFGEEAFLLETAHLERPLDGRAAAADGEAAVLPSRYGDEAKIDLGGVRGVELHLARQRLVAQLERREIEERQADGLLDLEGLAAGKKDAGAMGLDDLDVAHGLVIGRRGLEERNNCILAHGAGRCRSRLTGHRASCGNFVRIQSSVA